MIILKFTLLDVTGFILALGIKAPDFREFIVSKIFFGQYSLQKREYHFSIYTKQLIVLTVSNTKSKTNDEIDVNSKELYCRYFQSLLNIA